MVGYIGMIVLVGVCSSCLCISLGMHVYTRCKNGYSKEDDKTKFVNNVGQPNIQQIEIELNDKPIVNENKSKVKGTGTGTDITLQSTEKRTQKKTNRLNETTTTKGEKPGEKRTRSTNSNFIPASEIQKVEISSDDEGSSGGVNEEMYNSGNEKNKTITSRGSPGSPGSAEKTEHSSHEGEQ
eukprot:194821_1